MNMQNIKPGAYRQPAKANSPRKRARLTAAQREIHSRIEAQSTHSLSVPPRQWHPEEYPDLWNLVQAAKAAARVRRRIRGRMVFSHESRSYAARFTNLDRIIIEDRQTGRFIASSGFFAL
jgi:hypothetical protein